jgi:hypothetical protein
MTDFAGLLSALTGGIAELEEILDLASRKA